MAIVPGRTEKLVRCITMGWAGRCRAFFASHSSKTLSRVCPLALPCLDNNLLVQYHVTLQLNYSQDYLQLAIPAANLLHLTASQSEPHSIQIYP